LSKGVVFRSSAGDLVSCAVVAERMAAGAIEALRYPRNPLDVLAQQIVRWWPSNRGRVTALANLVRRAAPFAALPDAGLDAVLDMLAGRYPSEDRRAAPEDHVGPDHPGELRGRPGAQRSR